MQKSGIQSDYYKEYYSMISEKQCSNPECGKRYPATTEFFYRHTQGGLTPRCKECLKAQRREDYYNRPGVREKALEYNKRPKVRAYQRSYMETYNSRPEIREKERARHKANWNDPERRKSRQAYNKVYSKSYYQRPETKDRRLVWGRKYRKNSDVQERQRINEKVYRNSPKGRATGRVKNSNRRALKRAALGSYTAQDVQKQYERQKGKCYYCSVKLSNKYDVDHIIPLARGGSNNPDNIVLACPTCNRSKGDKYPWEFPEGGRLL